MTNKTIACAALLAAFTLGSTPLMAQDAASADKPAAIAKEVAKPAKKKAAGGARYQQCVKENTAVAQAYCATHAADCDAEMKAVEKDCRDEASGKKMTG